MEYDIVKYADIGKVKSGKRLPKGEVVSELISNNKYIRVRDISGNVINSKNVRYITDEASEKIKNYRVKTSDIIISVVGTVGSIAEIPHELNGAYLTENCDNLLVDERICLKKYLKHYLISKYGQEQIIANTVGSTQPKLPIYGIENFDIVLPDINIQNKIVRILDAFDNKILINNQINDNLFELLKIEFKRKFYNKNSDAKLLDFISNTIGGDWGKELPVDNYNTKVYCVRGADIPNMEYGNKGNAPTRYILEKNYNNKKLKPNNIIVEISGGSPTQSTGRTAYITENILSMYDAPLLCTNFCRAIQTKKEIYAPYIYMYLTLMYEDNIFFNWENGTTGIKNLALNDLLENIKITRTDEKELDNYYILFNNIMNKISNNSNENFKLELLRDTLLPKLMNGEIELDKIEI